MSNDIDIEGEHDHIVYAVPKRARCGDRSLASSTNIRTTSAKKKSARESTDMDKVPKTKDEIEQLVIADLRTFADCERAIRVLVIPIVDFKKHRHLDGLALRRRRLGWRGLRPCFTAHYPSISAHL